MRPFLHTEGTSHSQKFLPLASRRHTDLCDLTRLSFPHTRTDLSLACNTVPIFHKEPLAATGKQHENFGVE